MSHVLLNNVYLTTLLITSIWHTVPANERKTVEILQQVVQAQPKSSSSPIDLRRTAVRAIQSPEMRMSVSPDDVCPSPLMRQLNDEEHKEAAAQRALQGMMYTHAFLSQLRRGEKPYHIHEAIRQLDRGARNSIATTIIPSMFLSREEHHMRVILTAALYADTAPCCDVVSEPEAIEACVEENNFVKAAEKVRFCSPQAYAYLLEKLPLTSFNPNDNRAVAALIVHLRANLDL